MSQDRKFVDVFLLVLAVLIIISIGIFALSSQISKKEFGEIVKGDSSRREHVGTLIAPVGEVRLPGEENAADAEQEAVAATSAPVATRLTGTQVYNQACLACHGAGIAGAPVLGDVDGWTARIAQGRDVLLDHAINGYQGSAGYMPPKGGRTDLSDEEITDAVDFMVAESQ